MNKKLIKKLADVSYANGELNSEIIQKIATYLKRKELKLYIKALKTEEKKRTIIIETSSEKSQTDESLAHEIFKDKKIIFNTDPKILLGVRIIDNDNIYETTLQKTLSDIVGHVQNTYDQ